MAILDGCREAKNTPKLMEAVCPRCGAITAAFVKMGGGSGETGLLVSDETCPSCGFEAQAGTPAGDFKKP